MISLLGQVLLLRELSVAFYGVELVYLLGLSGWLMATGVGALLGRRRTPATLRGLAILLALHAFVLLGEVAFLRAARRLLFGVPGAFLPFERGLLVLVLGVAPVGLLLGILFQRAARRFVAEGGDFATAYALEGLGGVVGGTLATLALASGGEATRLALICGLAGLGAGLLVASDVSRPMRVALAVAALLWTGLLPLAPRLDRALSRLDLPELVESRDSPYARLAITRRGDQVSLFVNGALALESEGVEAEAFVHPILLQHPAPRTVAVLGGGIDGTVAEVIRHHPDGVVLVEVDEALLDLARRYLPERWMAPLRSPEVRVVVTDPRRFLETAAPLDVILIGMSDPDSGQANRFYVKEFFQACAQRLNPGGILGFKLRSAENLWTPLLARRMASIHRALAAVFEHVLVLPGGSNLFIASPSPLTRDPKVLVYRIEQRQIDARLVVPGYLEYLVTNDRVDSIAEVLRNTVADENTDRRPVSYRDAAGLWLSRFFPRLGYAVSEPRRDRLGAVCWGLGIAMVAAFLVVAGRRPSGRRNGRAAVAGFAGMVAESVLLLHYQSERGALFQDIGLLLTGFMSGLALGAWGYRRFTKGKPMRRGGAWLLMALVVTELAVAGEVRTSFLASLAGITAALTVVGFLVGAVLAQASQSGASDPQAAVSPLYAADLAGGSVGGLVGSLLLIPGFGLDGAAFSAAAVAAAGFFLLDRGPDPGP